MLTQSQVRELSTEDSLGCWIWNRHIDKFGYGKRGGAGAHRLAYRAFFGEIPAGLQIDHLCRNRACINPFHMEAVTKAVNQKRGLSGALKTHCNRGHALSGSNLYIHRGSRHCKKCDVIRQRIARSKKMQGDAAVQS